MTAQVSRPVAHAGRFDRLWWLPAGGHGNGLDDESWAPVLEVSRQIVPALLGMLRAGRRSRLRRPDWLGAHPAARGQGTAGKLSALGRRQRLRRGREGTANGDAVPRA